MLGYSSVFAFPFQSAIHHHKVFDKNRSVLVVSVVRMLKVIATTMMIITKITTKAQMMAAI
jgi:hypothetical protein